MISAKGPACFLFVSGHPRSGTNLFNRCLDGHPEVFSAPGVGKVNVLRRFMFSDWSAMSRVRAVEYLRSAIELKKGEPYLDRLAEVLDRRLTEPLSHASVSRVVFDALAEMEDRPLEGKRWLVEKNHNLEFYFERGSRIFDGSKLIFMCRDPVAIYASWKRLAERDGLDMSLGQGLLNLQKHLIEEVEEAAVRHSDRNAAVDEVATRHGASREGLVRLMSAYEAGGRDDGLLREKHLSWCALDDAEKSFAVRITLNVRHMLGRVHDLQSRWPERVMAVQYEELVRNPEATMRRCAAFLGISYDPVLVSPSEGDRKWGGNSSWGHSGGGKIYTASLRNIEGVSSREIEEIEEVFSDEPWPVAPGLPAS